jgi:hypothetical protein
MLTATQTGGFPGAGLAGAAACLPQVSNLVRARCPADISWLAFEARLLASLLTTARASAIHDGFVIMLGAIQIVAAALIMLYATRYPDTPCQSICLANPRPRQPTIASRLDEQAEWLHRRLSFAPHGRASRFVACKRNAPMTARVTAAPSASLAIWGGRLGDPTRSLTASGSLLARRICQHCMRAILSLGPILWTFPK